MSLQPSKLPRGLLAGAVLVTGVLTGRAAAGEAKPPAEWPRFHGARQDNISTETGLLQRWPAGGPKLLWTAKRLGHGFVVGSIADGRIYTAGDVGTDTMVTALSLAGKRLWQVRSGPIYRGQYRGARSTPTFVAGRLYHLSGPGHVSCLEAATGRRVWGVDLVQRFGARGNRWGLAESLVVDGRKVICTPGGPEVLMAALDKGTGRALWTCRGLGDKPAYVTPLLVEFGGLRQLVTVTAKWAVGVAIETGTLLWKYPHEVPYDANCISPVHQAGLVALAGTWGRGATGLRLSVKGTTCSIKEVWRTKDLDTEHGGMVRLGGYLYGQSDGNHRRRHWTCLDFKTGKTMWDSPKLKGKRSATLTVADGMLYVLTDNGEVALVRPSPKQFDVVSQFQLPKGGKGEAWAHPVVCGGRLHVRHGEFLYVYDVRAGK